MKGDHLCVFRKSSGVTHHGIDMGDGTVVDFSENDFGGRSINRRSMAGFTQGDTVSIHSKAPNYKSDEIAMRASIAHELGFGRYNLLSNNCEHFANWCFNGERRSKQVEDLSSELLDKLGPFFGRTALVLGHLACSIFPPDYIMGFVKFV